MSFTQEKQKVTLQDLHDYQDSHVNHVKSCNPVKMSFGSFAATVHPEHTIEERRNCGVDLHDIRISHEMVRVIRYD